MKRMRREPARAARMADCGVAYLGHAVEQRLSRFGELAFGHMQRLERFVLLSQQQLLAAESRVPVPVINLSLLLGAAHNTEPST